MLTSMILVLFLGISGLQITDRYMTGWDKTTNPLPKHVDE